MNDNYRLMLVNWTLTNYQLFYCYEIMTACVHIHVHVNVC